MQLYTAMRPSIDQGAMVLIKRASFLTHHLNLPQQIYDTT